MAKSQNTGAAAADKQTTDPATPTPVAPTTNPENDPTVVPPQTEDTTTTPPVEGAAAQTPVNDDPAPADENNDEPEQSELPEVKESMKRADLDAIAADEGLTNVSKYKDKAAVVAALERVRAGEDASTVDEELTPVVNNGGGDVEVEVVSPFYDLQVKTQRQPGDKYKTTETRASELRGHKLIK